METEIEEDEVPGMINPQLFVSKFIQEKHFVFIID